MATKRERAVRSFTTGPEGLRQFAEYVELVYGSSPDLRELALDSGLTISAARNLLKAAQLTKEQSDGFSY